MCVYINLLKSVNAGIKIKKTNLNVGCVCVGDLILPFRF